MDPVASQRWQQMRVQASPWLHEEVARRMEERLEWIKLKPARWASWAPLRGGLEAQALLSKRYPDAECFIVESSTQHAQAALNYFKNPWWKPQHWTQKLPSISPFAPETLQMVWANMALHMASEPQSLIAQWHQALAVDGFLMFSCLGPDTLLEMRSLYQRMGWPAASHDFTDMHDWGDMLVSAGFAEPVMDVEHIALSFETPERLLAELRTLGRNLHPQRFAGLRGRNWLQSLHRGLKTPQRDGQTESQPIKLTFEVIYGHAIKPAKRLAVAPQTNLSLAEMRNRLGLNEGAKTASESRGK